MINCFFLQIKYSFQEKKKERKFIFKLRHMQKISTVKVDLWSNLEHTNPQIRVVHKTLSSRHDPNLRQEDHTKKPKLEFN